MKSVIINKTKVAKPTALEPHRTRWMIHATCTRCNQSFSKLNCINTSKYCGQCEVNIQQVAKWFTKVRNLYGDKYSFEYTVFFNRVPVSASQVLVTCKHHGVFSVSAASLVNTNRSTVVGSCPSCAVEHQTTKNEVPHNEWVRRIGTLQTPVTLVSDTSGLHLTDKVIIKCDLHGRSEVPLAALSNSTYLCNQCAWEASSFKARYHRTNVPGTVYFFHLPKLGLWKLGVTYRALERRRTELGGIDFAHLQWRIALPTLADAYKLESALFLLYKQIRYKGPRTLQVGGYTELLSEHINKPSQTFIEETLCLNEPKTGNSDH